MALTLYRKYRPQTFAEVVGQNHIKTTIQSELENGKIAHAYLFSGPRGLGKTTMARLLAKAVNCLKRKDDQSEPCNACDACQEVITSRSLDVIEIDAASHTGVDNVRENIINHSRFTPTSRKYKVFIIDEVHMLSISAFNALLKTLEEPPAHAIFILCTTEIHKLPQTIISRCQRFDLRKVSLKDLKARLEKIAQAEGKKIEGEVLINIARHSEGCVRDAESLLGKIFTLGDKITSEQAEIILPRSDFQQLASFLNFIIENNSSAAIQLINNLVEDGVDLQIFTENLLEFLRKILLLKVSGSLSDFGLELDEQSQQSAEELSGRFDYNKMIAAIELFIAKRQEIKSALIQQFPLEVAVIQLTEELLPVKDSDDGDDRANGSQLEATDVSRTKKVKEKIKNKLAYLKPKRHQAEFTPLANIDLKPENVEEVKIDMASPDDKLNEKKTVKFSKVKDSWREIVTKLLEENYTLSSLLKISEPLKCEGNVLELAVTNKFYYDRLANFKNKLLVEKIISDVLKLEVKLKPVIRDEVTPMPLELDGLNSGSDEIKVDKSLKVVGQTTPESKSEKISLSKPADATQ